MGACLVEPGVEDDHAGAEPRAAGRQRVRRRRRIAGLHVVRDPLDDHVDRGEVDGRTGVTGELGEPHGDEGVGEDAALRGQRPAVLVERRAAPPVEDVGAPAVAADGVVEQEGRAAFRVPDERGGAGAEPVGREQAPVGEPGGAGEQPHETPLRPGELVRRQQAPAAVVEAGEEPAVLGVDAVAEPEREDDLLELAAGDPLGLLGTHAVLSCGQ
ncbi:hypothetical protein E1295_35520 [Nonomuraea mesophila]|uniref:Uncharacterized protein n=1 Tax=Nonomuraea mesophila TaxID=2530382 RepID=A0A4R5ENH5_9ACTN|nr:hypothetical protein [Nonomuraea mesophila]TDE36137.1 hypothetical protein E1295_35520 [Nonomuraea mesophila]